jgi:threonine dehydratase
VKTPIPEIPRISDIRDAASRIKPYINKTPVLTSNTFNKLFNASLFFKCENFQKAGAFKSRGAVNAVFSLSKEELANGVGTHSSGNHAQALARAAYLRNTGAYIVMPETSPTVKVDAVKSYGGKITFCKPTLRSREDTLAKIINSTGAIEIHPYNNPVIISGQGTAALEIFEEIRGIDIILAPVGGGGLLSGTAIATKNLSPRTKVIAAEPRNADDACRSFYSGSFVPSENPDTIADGLLTSLGSITFPIIRKYVDDIVTVSEDAIIEAMRLIWERMKIIIEPSSAVPLAAILENKFEFEHKRIAIILSGGNVDINKLPWK